MARAILPAQSGKIARPTSPFPHCALQSADMLRRRPAAAAQDAHANLHQPRRHLAAPLERALENRLPPAQHRHPRQQRARLSQQLPDSLDLLASSMRSGHSFLRGLQVVVTQMGSPIAEEFERLGVQ